MLRAFHHATHEIELIDGQLRSHLRAQSSCEHEGLLILPVTDELREMIDVLLRCRRHANSHNAWTALSLERRLV